MIGLSREELDQAKEDVLNTGQRRINRVKISIEQLEEEIKQLKTEIESNRKEFDSIDATIDNMREDISSLNGDERRLKEKVDTLQEDLEDKEADINELKEGLQDRVTRPQMYKQIRKELRSVDRLELSEVVSLLHEIISIRNNEDRTIAKNQELLHKLYENGLNQGEIAELVGVSRQTINQNMQ